MKVKEIDLKVTLEEANLILTGLGHLPFAKVYALVGKIQEQAGPQLGDSGPEAPAPAVAEPEEEEKDAR